MMMTTNTAGESDLETTPILAANMAETQYVRAKTAVWWDIENCQVPKGLDAHGIAQNIRSALEKVNYCGPVSISAFGDTNRIPPNIQQALNSTGIALNHVPAGAKDASDKKILVNMFCWALDNPAPGNLMLISGDRDFSDALHQLRLRRYNVLLAQPRKASVPLVHAARTVWLWTSLSAGGNPLSQNESLQLIADTTPQPPPATSLSELSSSSTQQSQGFDSVSDAKRILQNKFKVKYIPKPSIHQPAMPKVQDSKQKLIKKPHELFRSSSEPSVSTSVPGPTPSLPSSNAKSFSGPVMSNPQNQFNYPAMSNPQNQFNYPPRPVSFPPRQPYPNPHPQPSWNNGNNFPGNDGNNFPSNVNNHYPNATSNMRPPYGNVSRPYRPEDLFPHHIGNGFRPMPPRNEGPRFPSPPNICNLSLSQYPPKTQNHRPSFNPQVRHDFRPKYSPSLDGPNKGFLPSSAAVTTATTTSTTGVSSSQPNNGVWGTQECPPPSEFIQGLIGVILHALNVLKTEKVVPTESNISDCIQNGDPKHRSTDVKSALSSALEHQMIVAIDMGKLKMYIGKNEKLWNCVNLLGGNPKQYPKPTWDKIQQFLSSSSGRAAFMATQSRYEAAQVLKKECLKEYTLGDILRILNITATFKKWFTHHQTGWNPVTITLVAETTNKTATETTGWKPVNTTLTAETVNKTVATETAGWKPVNITLPAETVDKTLATETASWKPVAAETINKTASETATGNEPVA